MPWTQIKKGEEVKLPNTIKTYTATAIGKYGFGENKAFSRLVHFQLKKRIWGEESLFKASSFPTKKVKKQIEENLIGIEEEENPWGFALFQT